MNIQVEQGRVSKWLAVEELTIRAMEHGDGYGTFTIEDDVAPPIPLTELRVQGRIENASARMLTGVRYDVSYYDFAGTFLGLDRASLLEDNEIDPGDFLSFDMPLAMPEETHRCVFNVHAKRAGWMDRWM